MEPAPPMVGRLAERVLLEEQLALARAGHGRLAIVGGEAGIGKTTLARDLAVHARARGCAVLLGQSYDLMAVAPYGPWLDLFQRQGTGPSPAPTPDVFAGGLPEITNQMDVFVQVRAYLRALAESGPVLLVLEDAHWADPASLDMLRYIGVQSASIPLLVLVTYRVEELTRQNPFFRLLPNLIRETNGLRIDLKPLARRELRDFVESRYDLAESDIDRLVAYLDRHAEGNPFFVNELLRALEGEGEAGLLRGEGGWRLAGIEGIVVPPLVRQVIETRVARMGNVTRDALAVAAVIGQDVLLDLWSHVAGIDEATMLDIVDRAIEGSLFNASPDGTRVQFVHALTREALYQGIAPPRRRLIHQAVARALRDRAPVDPDPIAYHLRQARDPSAPEWLIRAGERAQRAYAWRSARDRFMEAAELLAETHADSLTEARLLYRCGRLQRFSDAAGGLRNLESAARLARQAGDAVLRADAIYSQSLLRCFADDWGPGVQQMTSGVEILEALSPEEGRGSWSTVNWMADALPAIELRDAAEIDPAAATLIAAGFNHRRGGLPWFMAVSGHLHAARDMADAFLRHVEGIEAGPLVLSGTAHSSFGLGIALSALGQPAASREAMGRAREIYGRLDHHAVIAFTYLTELTDVTIPWFANDLDGRQRLALEAEGALERAGEALPTGVSPRRAYLPLMYLEGRWRDACTLAAESAEHGTYVLRRQVTRALAPIAYHRGDRDEAWRQIRWLLPGGTDAQPGSAVLLDALMLQRLAINLCLDVAEFDEARAWLAAHQRWLDWSGALLGRADHQLAQARLFRETGDPHAEEAAVRAAIDAAAEPFQPLVSLEGCRVLGEVLIDRGAMDAAARELSRAVDLATACNAPFERALTLVSLARARRQASPEEALTLALEARAAFVELGAVPALGRIDAFLAGIGETGAPAPSPAGLTNRELEVLRLVAQGLTDAEVGARLFISPRTVGQHLRSTYGKLGVRSRAAATRFAMEHALA